MTVPSGDRQFLPVHNAIPTHRVIPAQAGIHVRGNPHTSSAGMVVSMDSGLRRNDVVVGLATQASSRPETAQFHAISPARVHL